MNLRRPAASTLIFIDEYCQWYRHLFADVRSYEVFKYLHVGMIAEIKRKSLPAIARICGLANEQGLLHFLTEASWQSSSLKRKRLNLILQVLCGRRLTLIIDESRTWHYRGWLDIVEMRLGWSGSEGNPCQADRVLLRASNQTIKLGGDSSILATQD